MDTKKAANRLYNARRSGCTLHLSDGLPPTVGYAVGREGWEVRLGPESCTACLIYLWVQHVQDVWFRLHPEAEWAIGVWYDKGFVYLDVVNVVLDRAEAIELGKDRSQLAIYDLEKGEEIRLD